MSEEDQEIIKCFTRCPNMLLYGLPQLPIQDKWLLITLMGLCWDRSQTGKTLEELEGPYQLTLRQISGLTGVDHTSLRSKQGKNPREGVLDRLERFGYLSVREGKPIDEYTGETLGHTQTYLYIHLRHIWEENNCFADAWRVPQNRLVREETIEFIVDHANSNVDHTNNSVGKNNSNVDQDNHTVDDASTKYVLRQCNTKKTKEDREKILASDDATPSLSQEELNIKALSYLIEKKEVTCYELEKFLSSFCEVEGTTPIYYTKFKNAVVWDNVSSEYYEAFQSLQRVNVVYLTPCHVSRYKNGRKLKLPIGGETLDNHEEKHWYPRVFKYIG